MLLLSIRLSFLDLVLLCCVFPVLMVILFKCQRHCDYTFSSKYRERFLSVRFSYMYLIFRVQAQRCFE